MIKIYNYGDNMVSIYDLLKEEKKKVSKLNELREHLVEEKRLRELDEDNIWVSTEFKKLGYTNDKLRAAYVRKQMNMMPNIYISIKNEFDSLKQEIDFIKETIDVMKSFGVDNIDLEEKDHEEGSSNSVSGSNNSTVQRDINFDE